MFGGLSALGWGTADFAGAMASRRAPATAVVLASQLISGVLAVALALLRSETFPGAFDLALSAGAGVATAVALAAFYRGLATARVGVVAPVAGVLGVAIPVVLAIAFIGPPAAPQLLGMALGLVGVGLVSRAPNEGDRPSGLGIALVAGLGFGTFFVCLGSLEGDAVFWPLVVARVVAAGALFLTARAARRPALPPRSLLPLITFVAVLDMLGMAGYLFASQIGRLDEAAVLSSLYPVVTIVLAAIVFRERIGRVQALGIGLAMLAIVLIGAG